MKMTGPLTENLIGLSKPERKGIQMHKLAICLCTLLTHLVNCFVVVVVQYIKRWLTVFVCPESPCFEPYFFFHGKLHSPCSYSSKLKLIYIQSYRRAGACARHTRQGSLERCLSRQVVTVALLYEHTSSVQVDIKSLGHSNAVLDDGRMSGGVAHTGEFSMYCVYFVTLKRHSLFC